MGTKDTRAAHGALGKTDMLLFDPERVKVVNDPDHPLYDARANEEPTEDFIQNLMVHGVTLPVVFRKDTETGESIIEDGRKRTLGLREANKRLRKKGVPASELKRLPGIPKRGSDGDAVLRMLMLNEQRFEDTPLNRARKAAKAIELGKTEAEVANVLGVSISTLKNLLRLIDAPAAVRNAVDAGKITASDGYRLAKLDASEAKEKVAELIEHAPRTPGKKRSKNAKKAKEIVGGAAKKASVDGLRAENVVENVKRELEEQASPSELHAGFVAALRWVLGEDKALAVVGLA